MEKDPNDKSSSDKPRASSVPPLLSASQPPVIGGSPAAVASPPPRLIKPAGKSWPVRRIFAGFGVCLIAIIGLALALALWNQLTRKDTTEDYVFLCESLFGDFQLNGGSPVMLSEAEQIIKGQKLTGEISKISRHGKKLAPIAWEFTVLFKSAEKINQNLPQGSKIVFGLTEAVLGAYTGQPEHVGTGGQKALQETERGWDTYKAKEAYFGQQHILAIKMAELVPQFSGPETNGIFLTGSFAEHKPGFWELKQRELLSLKNTSGRDLHNCVTHAQSGSGPTLALADATSSGGGGARDDQKANYENEHHLVPARLRNLSDLPLHGGANWVRTLCVGHLSRF